MADKYTINLKVVKMEYNIPQNMYYDGEVKPKYGKRNISVNRKIPRKIPEIVLKRINPCNPEQLIEQLLSDIYGCGRRTPDVKFKFSDSERCTSASIGSDCGDYCGMRVSDLETLSVPDLFSYILQLQNKTQQYGSLLAKKLYQRDTLKRRQYKICDILTAILKDYYDCCKYVIQP